MKRLGTAATLFTVLAVVAGCTSDAYRKSVLARAKALRVAPEYRIGEGDTITIRVLGQDVANYTIQDLVRPDGKVSFPEHGDIHCAGKTTAQLRSELEESFKQTLGLNSPIVYVAVNSFTSKVVTVLGEVGRPGRFPYTGQMRIADLLGLTGGTPPTAYRNRALLFREVDGNVKIYQVHLKDFFEKADFSTNFFVRPGDIFFVPKNGFAQVAQAITITMLPIRAIFDTVGLGSRTVNYFTPGP